MCFNTLFEDKFGGDVFDVCRQCVPVLYGIVVERRRSYTVHSWNKEIRITRSRFVRMDAGRSGEILMKIFGTE